MSLGVTERLTGRSTEELAERLVRLSEGSGQDAFLDIGGGTGALAERLAGRFSDIVVLEPDGRKSAYGIKRRRVSFARGVGESAPFSDVSFDIVSAIVSFHHIPDQDRALSEIRRLLKTGGILVIVEIDLTTSRGKFLRFVENKLLRHHIRFLSPSELREKVGNHSFRLLSGESIPRGYMLVAQKI